MTIAFWCVLIAIFLPYVCTSIAKFGGEGYGGRANADPRADEALKGLCLYRTSGASLSCSSTTTRNCHDHHRRLMGGIALHRADQVGHQVGAPLVLVEHFRPGGFHLFVAGLHGVVAAAAEQQGEDGKEGISEESRHGGTHPG